MKISKNKKLPITRFIGALVALPVLLTGLFMATNSTISAGGASDGEGNIVARLCYFGGTVDRAQWAGVESEQQACLNEGGVLVDPGQPSPLRFCYLGPTLRNLDDGEVCSDGATVEEGEPVPGVLKPDETVNNETTPNGKGAPTPITNEQREELRNCDKGPEECLKENPITQWILFIINFLSAGVAVVVTLMIIIGGIQYASAGPSPQRVQEAKKKIMNAIIAFVAYFFLYAFLQWLVPGGLF